MTIMGLDVGMERIGIALGDDMLRIASPWGVVSTKPEGRCFEQLHELIKKEGVEKVIIGMPKLLQMRDQATEQQRWIEAWSGKLYDALGIEYVFEDETLSTQLAQRWQIEQGGKGKRDDLAAVAILQGYFDRA